MYAKEGNTWLNILNNFRLCWFSVTKLIIFRSRIKLIYYCIRSGIYGEKRLGHELVHEKTF